MLYLRAIRSLERNGSVPKAALAMFRPATVAPVLGEVKFGVATRWRDLSFRNVPKDILVLNVLVTAVYGIGHRRSRLRERAAAAGGAHRGAVERPR